MGGVSVWFTLTAGIIILALANSIAIYKIKRPSLRGWIGTWKRWIYLYLSIAFIVMIPAMSYKMITSGLPKTVLLFIIPAHLLLSWSFYSIYKSRSR